MAKYVAGALVALTVGVVLLYAANEPFEYDEAVYLGIVREIGRTSCPIRPTLDPHLYGNNPPAVLYLAALARALGIGTLGGARAVHVVLWGLTGVLATYGCARSLFGARAGLAALALLLTQSAFLREAAIVKFDTPLATIAVALVWAVQSKHRRALLIATALAALATFARYQGALLGPTIAATLFLGGRRRDALWIFAGAVTGGLLWVGLAEVCDGDLLTAVRTNLGRVSGISAEPWFHHGMLEYWGDVARALGAPLLVGVALLLLARRRQLLGDANLHLTLMWPLVTLVFCSSIALKAERYFFPAIPLLVVAVSSLAQHIPAKLHRAFAAGMVTVGVTAAAGQALLIERSELTDDFATLGALAAEKTPPGRALVTAQAQVAYFADRPYFVALFEPSPARVRAVLDDPRVCTLAWDTRTLLLHPSIPPTEKQALLSLIEPRFAALRAKPPEAAVWTRCTRGPLLSWNSSPSRKSHPGPASNIRR